MEELERIYLADTLFRIDPVFEKLIQIGDPDNVINFRELNENEGYYSTLFDRGTKNIAKGPTDEADGETFVHIVIPENILTEGYAEGSDFARKFNRTTAIGWNIKLIDADMLKLIEEQPLEFRHRTLPEINIGGFDYEIDVAYNILRQKEDPFKVIAFNDMEKGENGYSFSFNKEDQSIDFFNEPDNKNIIAIYLPEMVKLDPEGMAIKYGIPKESLPGRDDRLDCDHHLLDERLKRGSLPVIRIVDEDYFVDVRMSELRSVNQFWKTINFNDALGEEDDSHLYFYYDYLKRSQVSIPETVTEIPKNVVLIALPHEFWLDPIAVGRKYADDPLAFIDNYPLQHKMEARVFPLSKTGIPYLIGKNLKEQKQPKKKGRRL